MPKGQNALWTKYLNNKLRSNGQNVVMDKMPKGQTV